MESDKNRDFAKNSRTKEESVGLILKAIKERTLIRGTLVSDNNMCHCALGCLFTENQLVDMKKADLNEALVGDVAKAVGVRNLEAMTGISVLGAGFLVAANDFSEVSLINYLKKLSPTSFQ